MPWEDGTKAGRKNSRPTKPVGFDGCIELMGKKKEAEEVDGDDEAGASEKIGVQLEGLEDADSSDEESN